MAYQVTSMVYNPTSSHTIVVFLTIAQGGN